MLTLAQVALVASFVLIKFFLSRSSEEAATDGLSVARSQAPLSFALIRFLCTCFSFRHVLDFVLMLYLLDLIDDLITLPPGVLYTKSLPPLNTYTRLVLAD